MQDYITVKEACLLLGVTRQSIFYLRKHNIIKDSIQIHATCVLYNRNELITLKDSGYGK
jgi:flagellar biogenesis protein FliO